FDALDASVRSHLMSDVPYGVLLSGGLDSSLIAALAARHAERRVEDDEQTRAWWPRLHSFAVGLEGSPDLVAAQQVADAIGTVHHGFTYTIQEGLDALEEVIYHLETYDVTTIRAATPMYLMARKIRAMGIKMVLSGEGADEIFGGYLYFHKAPDARAFHEETVRKLDKLHMFDCARANKAMAAWGVEARVPFLDKEFIDVAMVQNPTAKMITKDRMEKHILREAFADMLPASVAWRQKEQFSDGVGYSWIDELKVHAAEQVTDQQLDNAAYKFPHNTPDSKEGYWFRAIFEAHFPNETAVKCVPGGKSVACSTPEALAWDESFQNLNDPSGRSIKAVHNDSY
ncbi:MAG: asparagine synthase B, partial [Psychrobium sp.]|nr:asparagine synthase B [Psychrobium sp.]